MEKMKKMDEYASGGKVTTDKISEYADQVKQELQDLVEYKKGGWIQKVSKSMERKGTKGSFREYCGGKVTNECIQRGLKSPNPTIRKRAALAKAFAKMRKEKGGEVTKDEFMRRLMYEEGGEVPTEDLTLSDINDTYDSMVANYSGEGSGGGNPPGENPPVREVYAIKHHKLDPRTGLDSTIVLVKTDAGIYAIPKKIGDVDVTKIQLNKAMDAAKEYINQNKDKGGAKYLGTEGIKTYERSALQYEQEKLKNKKAKGGEADETIQDEMAESPEQQEMEKRQGKEQHLTYEEFAALVSMYPEYLQRFMEEVRAQVEQQQQGQQGQQQGQPQGQEQPQGQGQQVSAQPTMAGGSPEEQGTPPEAGAEEEAPQQVNPFTGMRHGGSYRRQHGFY